jgi:hypothetical protein
LSLFAPVDTDDLIRVGAAHDGGYVINERCVQRARLLVGLGISTNWEFEADFQSRNPRCRVIGIDHSVSAARFRFRGARYYAKALWYYATGRAGTGGARRARARQFIGLAAPFDAFFGRYGNAHLRRKFATRSSPGSIAWNRGPLQAALAAADGDHTVFVKMDIEGSEYATLPMLIEDARRIAGLAVEFHDCGGRWPELRQLVREMARDFVIVHVHGNNFSSVVPGTTLPRALEVTFLNRELLVGPPLPSPHDYPRAGLDAPNAPRAPDHPLRF